MEKYIDIEKTNGQMPSDTGESSKTGAISGTVNPECIHVTNDIFTVSQLKKMIASPDGAALMPEELERSDCWDDTRKAELVESVLLGLPLPAFYFFKDRQERLIIIDGQQRLSALFDYMDNRYMLERLSIYSRLNGKSFSELEAALRSRIENCPIDAHVIMADVPDSVKFDLFNRINRGGTRCNKNEIRSGLYNGPATQLLNRIFDSEAFSKATGGLLADERRMENHFLLVRFWAMLLVSRKQLKNDDGSVYEYAGDMDGMLGRTMDHINQMSPEEYRMLESLTMEALENACFYLGNDGFRLRLVDRKSSINKNAFEMVMYIMAMVNVRDASKKEYVYGLIRGLFATRSFKGNNNNNCDNSAKWLWRLEEAQRLGNEICGKVQ